MSQVPLKLVSRLSYAPENFIIHGGVRGALSESVEFLSRRGFRICCLHGKPRSGKTHLSIVAMDELGKRGLFPRLIEGAEFAESLRSGTPIAVESPEQVFIVDDADQYLSTVQPGESGPFVQFIESARVIGAGVLLIMTAETEGLPCDEHVKSRLNAALHLSTGEPADGDIPDIIHSIAKQRGLFLDAKKTNFLQRRLPRDIPAIELYVQRLNHLSQVLGKTIRFPLIADAL